MENLLEDFGWTEDICFVKVQKLNLKNKPFTEGLFAMQKNQKKMQIEDFKIDIRLRVC